MDFASLLIIALIGCAIGVLSGLFGIGGGTIIVPVLHLVFGLPITTATATSLFTIVPTSVSGMVKHHRNHTANMRFGVLLGIAGACTSPFGVALNEVSPDIVVTIVAGVVIVAAAAKMLSKAKPGPAARADGDPAPGPDAASASSPGASDSAASPGTGEMVAFDRRTVLAAVLIGAIAGVLSGYVGVGGGFIMVPLMVALMSFPLRYAAGTSLVAIAILAVPGTIAQALYGNIEYVYGLALMVGSIPGAQLGAWAVTRIAERPLRIAFGCLLICAGTIMVLNGVVVS